MVAPAPDARAACRVGPRRRPNWLRAIGPTKGRCPPTIAFGSMDLGPRSLKAWDMAGVILRHITNARLTGRRRSVPSLDLPLTRYALTGARPVAVKCPLIMSSVRSGAEIADGAIEVMSNTARSSTGDPCLISNAGGLDAGAAAARTVTRVPMDFGSGPFSSVETLAPFAKRNHKPGSLFSELKNALLLEAAQLSGIGGSWSAIAPQEDEAPMKVRDPARQEEAISGFSKLRPASAAAAIIDNALRNASSREELILELYDAPLSIRQVDAITQALWKDHLGSDEIRELHHRVSDAISSWLCRPLQVRYPIAFIDGTWLRWKWRNEEKSSPVLAAIGVNARGFREVLAVAPGAKENAADCERLLQSLRARGVRKVDFVIGDLCSGLREGLAATFPEACFQGCVPTFRDGVFARAATADLSRIGAMFDAIYESNDLDSARAAIERFSSDLDQMGQPEAAAFVAESGEKTLSVFAFPRAVRERLAGSKWVRKVFGELKERARTVGAFSDAPTAAIMVAAHLRQITRLVWADRRYLTGVSRVTVQKPRELPRSRGSGSVTALPIVNRTRKPIGAEPLPGRDCPAGKLVRRAVERVA